MQQRAYDIIVYGVTGFTGKLVAEYLSHNYLSHEVRWAVAGRNREKLDQVMKQLNLHVDIIEADSTDENSLKAMADQTNVVLTVVGPYLRYGEPLVKACVEAGTHYCDLTGEMPFIFDMIDKYHDKAKQMQVKIVHSCGFDSIPSDIGSAFLQQQAKENLGSFFPKVKYYVRAIKGTFSRGTAESLMDVINLGKDREIRKRLGNVNALTSLPPVYGVDQSRPLYDKFYRKWTTPFIMEKINSRIVRRSHFLWDCPWGDDFHYSETMLAGAGPVALVKASVIQAAVTGFALTALHPTSRKLASKFLPEIGDGPSPDIIENGFFRVAIHGIDKDGTHCARVKFNGPKDPGYGSTAIMLAESAVALSIGETTAHCGVGTPSAMIGTSLVERLSLRGFEIEFETL